MKTLVGGLLPQAVEIYPPLPEELGQRLKRRYQQQQQRQGLPPVGRSRAEAELDHVLGKR